MTTEEKPTILLIHGSWHTPLHYRHLIDALRARGHPVLAPVLPTTGHDDSIDGKTFLDAASQVRGLLVPYLDQDRKVVIVAHSFGGIVTAHIVAGLSLEERSAQGLKGGVTSIVYIAAQLSPENLRFKPGNAPPFFEWIDVRLISPFILVIPLLGSSNLGHVVPKTSPDWYIVSMYQLMWLISSHSKTSIPYLLISPVQYSTMM